jgi:hypothetical protein
MLEQLKEIKEKLNSLIQEVENLESAIQVEEIIIQKKDFKFIKRLDNWYDFQILQFNEGVVFEILGKDNTNQNDHWKYTYSIFKALLEDKLERIILLKRKADLHMREGYLITHEIENEVDTKLRDNYRSK